MRKNIDKLKEHIKEIVLVSEEFDKKTVDEYVEEILRKYFRGGEKIKFIIMKEYYKELKKEKDRKI